MKAKSEIQDTIILVALIIMIVAGMVIGQHKNDKMKDTVDLHHKETTK